MKRSTVPNHVKSVKHGESKAKQKKKLAKDMIIVTALKKKRCGYCPGTGIGIEHRNWE